MESASKLCTRPHIRTLTDLVVPIFRYWNEEGEWIGKVEIPDTSLESLEQQLDGVEKKNFLQFMRKMLQWRPEDRSSWKDILMDEWLLADLIESGEVVVEED